jgi:acid phosphatase
MTSIRILAAVALAGFVGMAAPAIAQGVPQNDNLNATLWMQRSVEYKGAALTAYALAKYRLDQALADKNWTGAPAEQKGSFQNLPPAIIVDLDETAIDNSGYQAWMVMKDTSFDPKTWNAYVKSVASLAVPGALDFLKYAESKGVKIFYVSNRTADEEAASRQNLEKLGFPMGGNVDVFLFARKQPDWGSAKGTRRAHIAKDYRVLLNLGDNFGDFVDEFRGSEAERLKVFEANRERWGREWIVLPNPTYGSFESAPFGHDFKKSQDERRDAKRKSLEAWAGP